jgi:hypothetical protein
MIRSVTHANLVRDEVFLDANRIPRPHELKTTNVLQQSACLAPTFSVQPQSATVVAGDIARLSATAAGETGYVVSYQWYRGSAGDRTAPLGAGTAISGGGTEYYTTTLTTTTKYWVEASNACPSSATASATAVLTVCHVPAITTQPQNKSITRSQSVTLTVDADENGTASYQWYTVSSAGGLTPISGATFTSLDAAPTQTTKYRVRITNGCGLTSSQVATVTVAEPPTAPPVVNVTSNVTSNGVTNTITWSAASSSVGVSRYIVQRRDGYKMTVYMPAALSVVHGNGLTAGKAYLYRVRAVDGNGVAGPWSVYDSTVAIAFTGFPVAAGAPIGGGQVGQLRQAIDALRAEAGLPAIWTGYTGVAGTVKAAHFNEMRSHLNHARANLGLRVITFSRPTLQAGQTRIYAADLQELANGVQ